MSESPDVVTNEIAIFTAASDTFNLKNTNCTIAESLIRLATVVSRALELGLRVRGYISTVVVCPYEGHVNPEKVRDVARELLEMGCYEISLGDTVGAASPRSIETLLDSVLGQVPVERLAAHNHDTFGMAVANVLTAVRMGVRTVDSSVGGLGGCPYSPGATGNAATEDVVWALEQCGYSTNIDMDALSLTGEWISDVLKRENASRAGKAWLAKKRRSETG